MPAIPESSLPRLHLSPAQPTLDTPLRMRLDGLPPGREVTLRASQLDPRGCEWQSAATFTAAADGTVDLRRDAPRPGCYPAADPMGLVWSMEPAPGAAAARPPDFLASTPFCVRAEIGGAAIASARCARLRVPAGLTRTEVRSDGLVGTLWTPAGEPRPGVLMLGGSEGGMHEDDAALLAGHGYAVLALAYYGLPGLPATLRDIPLEYFGRALAFLREPGRVSAGGLAVIGASKGGEAALLIGAVFPRVRAVVSVVGSGVVTQGISQDVRTGAFLDIIRTPVASWTYHGRELPYVPNAVTAELAAAVAAGEPVALRLAFEAGMRSAGGIPAATIPVEKINGAVLLISGGDDQGYGPAFQDIAARRLARHRHPHPWDHLVFEDAGHLIAQPPYGPTTSSLTPGPGVTFRHGGTPAADARARAAGWQAILAFLAREFPAPGSPGAPRTARPGRRPGGPGTRRSWPGLGGQPPT
jgi:dienelactone hydrolase